VIIEPKESAEGLHGILLDDLFGTCFRKVVANALRRKARAPIQRLVRSHVVLLVNEWTDESFNYLDGLLIELIAIYPPHRERVSSGGMNLSVKRERRKQNRATDELREEVEMLDIMLSSLVDVLEKRGIVGHDEWKKRTKERLSSK
jgi:hypothetical protein